MRGIGVPIVQLLVSDFRQVAGWEAQEAVDPVVWKGEGERGKG